MSFVRSGRRDMFRSAAELRQQGRVPNTLFRVRRPIHPFIDVNRIKKQSVTRAGICISPAGEERLPAGLAPAKSLQGCAMSKRRGRRRTRKAIKAQNRGHLAMSRSRNTGPRPCHDVRQRTRISRACSRRRAMRSAVSGWVLKSFMRALPVPSNGLTMYILAVAGLASGSGAECVT